MQNRVGVFFVFLPGLCASPLYAQRSLDQNEPPLKWEDIPQEHLEADRYAPDSNAAVVVLADYGNVFFEDDGTVIFERHTRIKILTEAGYDWGTVSLAYLGEDRLQEVKDLEGQTYVRAEGGGVETHELEKGSIFREDVDGQWERVRFTLPALQPGAVIEYRYKVVSAHARFFPDWSFQKSEPVLWSEYRAEIPEIYRYVSVYQGQLQPDIVEQEPYSRMLHWSFTFSTNDDLLGFSSGRDRQIAHASTQVSGVKYRWVMQEVPALRQEPYMTTPENFRSKIRFELAEIGRPSTQMVQVSYQGQTYDVPAANFPVTPVMTSWEQLAEELIESKYFGQQIGKHRKVRDQARALVEGIADPRQKMQAVYDYLRTTMAWNERRGVFAGQDLDDALEAGSVSSPEMALLLVSMLREAGLEAHPVLISTRSHGQVLELYPLISQFNDVLVYVEIDGQGHLLDATDALRPYTLLPPEALNGKGFLVRETDPAWISIAPAEHYRHQNFLRATLDGAGQLVGTLEASDGGYSALDKRHALKEADTPEVFIQETFFDDLEGAQVDSCAVTHEEAVAEPLKTEAAFSVPGYAQVAGGFMYFNLMPVGRLGENPLRLPERTFPVDLAYPMQQIYTLHLTLPEGYAVQEVPRSVRILLPDESGSFQRLVQVEGNVVMVQTQFVIKQSIFEPEVYEPLRSFFEQVVAAQAEQVVLKRS